MDDTLKMNYRVKVNNKSGTIYCIDDNSGMVYTVGNIFMPMPEWVDKQLIVKKYNIEFSSNKRVWWESVIQHYGPQMFDDNPFPIDKIKREDKMNKNKIIRNAIAETIRYYNIPLTKSMILEINDYINDYVENMDVESSYNADGSSKIDLIDSIMSNPALKKEMEAFILLLMDEAERQRKEKQKNKSAIEDFASADETIPQQI